jgi:predicted RNase H-like nuclease (RuvC/YqgF family)
MNLTTIALVIGLIGSAVPPIAFFTFYRLNRRKKAAEARLIEQEGDLKSLAYFRETIKQLVEDNKELKNQVQQLQKDVDYLKKGKSAVEIELDIYKKAAKMIEKCKNQDCPAYKEFHRLKNRL